VVDKVDAESSPNTYSRRFSNDLHHVETMRLETGNNSIDAYDAFILGPKIDREKNSPLHNLKSRYNKIKHHSESVDSLNPY